ncbi:MAG: hypothetical protein M3Q65_19240 [Chloroflexota bacterium]|nr:hypothetical protein [Chloroflexota bacterium]
MDQPIRLVEPAREPCIILANEPRAYREVIAAACWRLRPQLAVTVVEPDELDARLRHRGRDERWLVVHSRPSPAVEAGSFAWVRFAPDGEPGATVGLAGHRATLAVVGLDNLLAILDEVVALARATPPPVRERPPLHKMT